MLPRPAEPKAPNLCLAQRQDPSRATRAREDGVRGHCEPGTRNLTLAQRRAPPPAGRAGGVACDTGLSFAPLLAGVGAGGRVVGVELSPEMAAIARARVAAAGWDNVDLHVGDVAALELPRHAFDAALLHYTHDVRPGGAAGHIARPLPICAGRGCICCTGCRTFAGGRSTWVPATSVAARSAAPQATGKRRSRREPALSDNRPSVRCERRR